MSEKAPETREELVQHLEKLAGRTLKTREDIQAYVAEMSARKGGDAPSVRRWTKAKHVTLFVVLAFAFIQFYLLDVFVQILTLREVTYFAPASARLVKSLLEVLYALA